MAHQALYRRYRPRRFGEIVGQEHVVKALRNAVRDNRVGHAYLFSGPRGTGKTSSARILAKALNCLNPLDGEPCCECTSCVAVEAGISFDVHEMDAASNRRIDDMRELLGTVALASPGRTKVYILDEVHQLTTDAVSALLKTLEEPPDHVVFVLATTDPQKVPATIRSRTQHLEFHLLPSDALEQHVRWVVADAGLIVDEAAIEAVMRQGGGSARDTLSALDQVAAAGGAAPEALPIDELIESLIERDTGRALAAVAAATQAGRDARALSEELVAQLREVFLSLMAPELVRLPDRVAARIAEQAHRLGPAATVRAMEVLGDILVEMRHAPDPRLLVDVAMVRLTNTDADHSTAALLERIERLERQLAAFTAGGLPATTPHAPAAAQAPSTATATAPAPVAEGEPTGPAAARAVLGAARQRATNEAVRASGTAQAAHTAPPPSPRNAEPPDPAPAPPASPKQAIPAEPVAAAPASADDAPRLASPPAAEAGADAPDRDQLTLLWADRVLPQLKPMVKARYAMGRFLPSQAGFAVFALPNAAHRDKCDSNRADVEQVLSTQFGRPVRLKLVVDKGEAATLDSAPPAAPDDEVVDLSELVDAAPDSIPDGLQRLAKAFPGAEVIEDAR